MPTFQKLAKFNTITLKASETSATIFCWQLSQKQHRVCSENFKSSTEWHNLHFWVAESTIKADVTCLHFLKTFLRTNFSATQAFRVCVDFELTCGSPSWCEQSSWSKSTSTASTNCSLMAWRRASFVSTRWLMRSSTISRFSLSIAISKADRPSGSTQLMLM